MIDSIWVPPSVHVYSGTVVLVATLLAMLVTAFFAWRKRKLNAGVHALLIATQVTLIVQAVIGIKLLDQGLGPMQLFIHYLGGLGPLLFFLLFYWLPRPVQARRWTAFTVTTSAFMFALMAFFIGMSYVASQVA